MSEWQPIETAPKDEQNPILIFFDHEADTYYQLDDPTKLTDYAAVAEGGDFCPGSGITVAVWRDGYHDNDGWESSHEYWVPGGWFPLLAGDAADQICNAIHWKPLPDPPQ